MLQRARKTEKVSFNDDEVAKWTHQDLSTNRHGTDRGKLQLVRPPQVLPHSRAPMYTLNSQNLAISHGSPRAYLNNIFQ